MFLKVGGLKYWLHCRCSETFKVCHSQKRSCRSERLTDPTRLVYYCLVSVHTVCACLCTQWKTKQRHSLLSTPPSQGWPSAAPLKSTDVWIQCFSASPQCSVSRPTCHCQPLASGASRLGLQAHQHLPGVPEATRRLAVPGRAAPVVGLNGGGLCPEEKDEEGAEGSALFRAYGLPKLSRSLLITSEWSPS